MKTMRNFSILLISFIILSSVTYQTGCAGGNAKEADSLKNDSLKKKVDLSKYNRRFNDIARLLAGLEQEAGSDLKAYDTLQVSKEYRKSINEFFAKLKKDNFGKIEKFRESELKDINTDSMTIFYPFSGPDFAHIAVLFPGARTTIMFGLEPVGNVPDIKGASNVEMAQLFKALRISIDSIAPLGYFMTNEMGRDFHRVSDLNGNLPVIATFMAQWGYRILDVKKFTVSPDGKVADSIPGVKDQHSNKDHFVSGGMIEYMFPNEDYTRKVYYFSQDVSDEYLKLTPQFLTFVNSFKYDVTFLKAASYLCSWMHTVRNTIMQNTKIVVQDDSGIPVKYFESDKWDMRFYGKYSRTLKVFQKAFFQQELKQMYDTCKTVKPIDFAFGYGVRINQSNLMIAKKKEGVKVESQTGNKKVK